MLVRGVGLGTLGAWGWKIGECTGEQLRHIGFCKAHLVLAERLGTLRPWAMAVLLDCNERGLAARHGQRCGSDLMVVPTLTPAANETVQLQAASGKLPQHSQELIAKASRLFHQAEEFLTHTYKPTRRTHLLWKRTACLSRLDMSHLLACSFVNGKVAISCLFTRPPNSSHIWLCHECLAKHMILDIASLKLQKIRQCIPAYACRQSTNLQNMLVESEREC